MFARIDCRKFPINTARNQPPKAEELSELIVPFRAMDEEVGFIDSIFCVVRFSITSFRALYLLIKRMIGAVLSLVLSLWSSFVVWCPASLYIFDCILRIYIDLKVRSLSSDITVLIRHLTSTILALALFHYIINYFQLMS